MGLDEVKVIFGSEISKGGRDSEVALHALEFGKDHVSGMVLDWI